MSRVLWYLIDAGAVGQVLCNGWQRAASEQLKLHRITINRNTKKLMELGLLDRCEGKGEVSVKPEVFAKAADQKRLRTKKIIKVKKHEAREARNVA